MVININHIDSQNSIQGSYQYNHETVYQNQDSRFQIGYKPVVIIEAATSPEKIERNIKDHKCP